MANVLRISLTGAMPGGEEWSVNPCFVISDAAGAPAFEQIQSVATAVAALVLPTGIRNIMNPVTNWSGVRVEARLFDGTLQTQADAIKGTPTPGTGASNHPFQTAMVSSLRAAAPGASSRGRLYWPATGVVLDASTLRPASAIVGAFTTGVRDFLTLANAAVRVTFPGSIGLSVWSRKNTNSSVVTKILGGDVIDTQRRRRDTLLESYTTLGFPGP
jgi:hypothetical protein